jgi:hypothetical protein
MPTPPRAIQVEPRPINQNPGTRPASRKVSASTAPPTSLDPRRVALVAVLTLTVVASAFLIARKRSGAASPVPRPASALSAEPPSGARRPNAAKTTVVPPEGATIDGKRSAPEGDAPALVAPIAARQPKSIERNAADAVATGAFADALPLYEQLARQHPEAAVYREAARLVRTKLRPSP